MANEVEIRITATDLTGSAFAGVLARLAALKAAADDAARDRQMNFDIGDALAKIEALKAAADGISFGHIDMTDMNTSLMALKSKLQSLGIADLADIDVQPGRLMTQLQLLKRLINQAGVSDVLDFNLTPADLTSQLEKLSGIALDIPIKFDMAKLPPLGSIGTEHVPITFDYGRVVGPHMPILNVPAHIDVKDFVVGGETMPILNIPANIDVKDIIQAGATEPIITVKANIDLGNIPIAGELQAIDNTLVQVAQSESAVANAGNAVASSSNSIGNALTAADIAISPFLQKMVDMGHQMTSDTKYMSMLGMGFSELIPWVEKVAEVLAYSTIPNMGIFMKDAEMTGSMVLNLVSIGFSKASDAVTKYSLALDSGIPVWKAGAGAFGALTGKLQLFGGWLTKLGAPAWLASVSGMHILTEGIVEFTAVVLPAAIALGAFVGAAIPTFQDMYKAEQNMYTVSSALGLKMPGLSGGFSQIAAAVQPNVYILAGEALNTINSKTGEFQTIAQGAGQVVDSLGARIEMALGGNGLTGFISHGVDDLDKLGNTFGNVFGIIGNLLKTVPGYAEILLGLLQNITGVLENITASGAVQGIVGLALALHGAIFYAGLAGTGLLALRGPLTSIVAWALDGVATLAALGSAFLEEAAAAGIASAVMDTLALANPWVLAAAGVAVLVGGIIALVHWLGGAVNAQREYLNQVENTISAQTTFSGVIGTTQGALQTTNNELAKTPQYVQQTVTGFHGMTRSVTEVNSTYTNLQNNSKALTAQLGLEQSRREQLIKIFGSSTAAQNAMTQAGIKVSDIANANSDAWAKDIIQLKALNSATVQLAGYQNGQAAAAQNALNVMGGTITDIQKVTQAEDGLMGVVTGSVTAFDAYGQGLHTLGVDSKVAGASIGGLNDQSFALNAQFYAQVQSSQKVIDALMQQQEGTKGLTTATATMVGQMLPFAGANEAARATLVAMINNALGPGTVSLQTLDHWVKTNATSFQGLSNIITQATLNAGSLANVLQNDLNAQFQDALLKSSGASQMIQQLANDITKTGNNSAATRGDRAALILDLENTGMSAHDATAYVDGLQNKVDAMHGKSVTVTANTTNATVAINAVQALVNSLHGSTVYIDQVTRFYTQNLGSSTSQGKTGQAHGGITGLVPHAASGGWRQGLTMVGELGPELVRLPAGSQVYPTGVTPGYASQGGGGGGGATTLVVESAGATAFEQFMVTAIKEWVRLKGGGNVQKAFGIPGK